MERLLGEQLQAADSTVPPQSNHAPVNDRCRDNIGNAKDKLNGVTRVRLVESMRFCGRGWQAAAARTKIYTNVCGTDGMGAGWVHGWGSMVRGSSKIIPATFPIAVDSELITLNAIAHLTL